jgi:GWxTD domain-containing protein
VLLLVVMTSWVRVPAFAGSDPLARARLLHRAVQEKLDDADLETRLRSLSQLREAIDLDPQGLAGNHWFLMGYLRELGRYDAEARSCYRNAQAQAPRDRETWLALGRVYSREFLRRLDRESLARAVAVLDTATTCPPLSSVPWLALVPLLYEQGNMPRAAFAAERSLVMHPRLPAAGLAAGLMAWRTGNLERADSLFRATLPKLPESEREYFERPDEFVGRTGPPGAPAGLAGMPDPDPTTPENEIVLEYWARVAHAYLLFNDPLRPGLDQRAATYIRYGPPARVDYNPLGASLTSKGGSHRQDYPMHVQVWVYPDLNMRITLHDRSLLDQYTSPAVPEPLPNSAPDPGALSRRHDLFAIGDGFAVFPKLPPASQRVEVQETLVAFEGATGPRLAAFVQADRESLEARWVVTDATGRTVASGGHAMDRSSCGGGTRASTEFSAELPPGRYDVAVSARDGRGHRGFQRTSVTLQPAFGTLSLSDLVLCCGEPALMVTNGVVRLEPLADAVARGTRPLTAYFEIYHLAQGSDGLSRYTFDYRVERLAFDKAARRLAPTGTFTTWASRDETFQGDVRRQFLSVRIASLPPGGYRLTLTVHDTLAGTSDSRSAAFTRE